MNDEARAQTAVRYLLDELPETDREAFEEEYLADEELFEYLEAMRSEVIDAWVQGGLTETQSRYVAGHLLNRPDAHDTVRFASALQTYLCTQSPGTSSGKTERRGLFSSVLRFLLRSAWPPTPRFEFAAAVFILALAGIVAWQFGPWRRSLEPQVAQHSAAPVPAAPQQDALKNQAPPPVSRPASSPTLVAMVLVPGMRGTQRAAGTNVISLPPGPNVVRLQLDLGEDQHTQYSATIQDADATITVAVNRIERRVSGGKVTLWVFFYPDRVPEGEYILRLKNGEATETIGDYVFDLVRAPKIP